MKKYHAIQVQEDDDGEIITGYLHIETPAVSKQELMDKPLTPRGRIDLQDATLFDVRSTAQEVRANLEKDDSGILSTRAHVSRTVSIVEVIIEVDGTRRLADEH